MSDGIRPFRRIVIEQLETLSSEFEQRRYQKNVPFANVPDELLCKWFDDLPIPEGLDEAKGLFSNNEFLALKEFSNDFDLAGRIIRMKDIPLEQLLATPEWRVLMKKASAVLSILRGN